VKRARGSRLLARSNPVLGGLPSVPDSFHHQDKNLMHFVRLGIFFGSLHWFNPLSDIDVVLSDLDADHLYAGGCSCLGCDIVRSCYLAVRVFRMFMLLATMEIWYLHDLLTIQSQTSNLGVT